MLGLQERRAFDRILGVAEVDDALDVLVRLCGQADHEVHLDEPPAAGISDVGRLEELFIADQLVDRESEPLASHFRREGEAGSLGFLDLVGDFHSERVGAERRKRDRDPLVPEAGIQDVRERLELRVVGGGDGGEPDLVPPRGGDPLLGDLHDLLHAALPDRSIEIAGLAKPATLRAPAEDFDGKPVLHDLLERDDRLLRSGRVFQIHHELPENALRNVGVEREGAEKAAALIIARLVHSGDVDARDFRELSKQLLTRAAPSLPFGSAVTSGSDRVRILRLLRFRARCRPLVDDGVRIV